MGIQFINPNTAMTSKTVFTIAIAAVTIAVPVVTSAAYGFAESFAAACIVMMLPLAIEPLEKARRLTPAAEQTAPHREAA